MERLRLTAIALVLSWFAAPLCVVGLGIHLAGEDHGDDAAAALGEVAAHGHHHPVATADHDHVAVRGGRARVLPPWGASPVELPGPLALPAPVRALPRSAEPTESPPLFTSHCALLL